MSRRIRRLRRAALGGALFVAMVLVGAWWIGGKLVEPAHRPIGAAPEGFNVRDVTLHSESGQPVYGWWIDAEGEDVRGSAVLLHPLRGDRRAMLQRARLLLGAGFDCLVVDLFGHGASRGPHLCLGWQARHDARAAVEFAKAESNGGPVAVVGWSLGGASALLAAPLRADALVLESVYPDLRNAIQNRIAMRFGPLGRLVSPLLEAQLPLRLGCRASDLKPIAQIHDVGCPVLVLGGTEDRRTTIAETRALFDRASPPKSLTLFNGTGHVDLQRAAPERYEAALMDFLDQWIPHQAPAAPAAGAK